MTLRFGQKLVVPSSTHKLVDRAHMLDHVGQAIKRNQVVVLAAQAGWGKTMLLAQWAATNDISVAWYTLDKADRDPHLFLDYLLHAIKPFVPDAEDLIIQLPNTPANELQNLFRAAALAIANAPTPFVLVLDDFHTLEEDYLPGTSLVVDFLATIAEYAPQCTLVLASRTVPALRGLVRLGAQDRAAVFDYTALQWSVAEVQQLAGIRYGTLLADALAERLVAQVGGWITGIVLSLNQAVQGPEQLDLAAPANPAQLYAFFDEQIITPLSLDLQVFLEETSVLHDLSPQHCDRLRNQQDSRRYLDEIRRRGFFVSSRGGWVSYHSLLHDFLRDRLARDPTRERTLLTRAGDLYRDEDDISRSLDCYLAAGATTQAVAMLRDSAQRLRQRAQQTTLLSCLERLTSIQALPPDLLLVQAQAYSDISLWERATTVLHIVETISDAETRWEAQILLTHVLSLQMEFDRASATINDVPCELLSPRLQLHYHMAAGRLAFLLGHVDEAMQHFEQAQTLVSAESLPSDNATTETLASIHDHLGWAYALLGNRRIALRHLQRAEACWQLCGNTGRRAATLNNLGTVAMQEQRYAEARAALETGLKIARNTARRREESGLVYSLAEIDLIEGDLVSAFNRFCAAHSLAVQLDIDNSIADAAVSACWVAALLGDRVAVQSWSDIIATLDLPHWPELGGRWELIQSHLLLLSPQPDYARIAELSTAAAEKGSELEAIDRAALALVLATLTLAKSGWTAAAPLWKTAEAQIAQLHPTLVAALGQAHRPLIEAAATRSSIAKHTLTLLPTKVTCRWQITALGDFACLIDDIRCDLAPLYRAVLVRLLDAGPGGIAVEDLMADVWDGSTPSRAAIHQALRRLRLQTGLEVAARDGICAIWSGWEYIRYDVREFEDALRPPFRPGAVDAAMLLYRGDFFPGAPEGAVRWAARRRTALQMRAIAALEQAARLIEVDDPQQAMQYYQHILELDGCREDAAAQLMRLAGRFGNMSLVSSTFRQLEKALGQLGTTPEAETVALYQQHR